MSLLLFSSMTLRSLENSKNWYLSTLNIVEFKKGSCSQIYSIMIIKTCQVEEVKFLNLDYFYANNAIKDYQVFNCMVLYGKKSIIKNITIKITFIGLTICCLWITFLSFFISLIKFLLVTVACQKLKNIFLSRIFSIFPWNEFL